MSYGSWRQRYGQGRLFNKHESNCQCQPLSTTSLPDEMEADQRLTVVCILVLYSQCPVVHLQIRRVRGCIAHWWQQHVSTLALALQLTPHTVSVTWANIVWTPSVILQLPKHFSYLNTLLSQRVQISDLLEYWHSLLWRSMWLLNGCPYGYSTTTLVNMLLPNALT